MGGALFEALHLFYGTNEFCEIDGVVDDEYELTSQELDPSDLPAAFLHGIQAMIHNGPFIKG